MRGFSKTVLTVCENRFPTQFAPEIYKEKELIKRWGTRFLKETFLITRGTRLHRYLILISCIWKYLQQKRTHCCWTEIYFIDFLSIWSVFSQKICSFLFLKKKKRNWNSMEEKRKMQSRKSETFVTRYPFTVPYYLSGHFSRIPL